MIGATLQGANLPAGRIQWTLRPGTRPHLQAFVMSHAAAAHVVDDARGGNITLAFAGLTVTRLMCLGDSVPPMPQLRSLVIADRRWEWSRSIIVRDYNVRRHTGETRRLPGGRVETQTMVDDVAYAPWSLKNAKAWTAFEVLADVLAVLVTDAAIRYEDGLESRIRQVPIENLQLDDRGPSALDRVLAYLPGVNLFVNLSGEIVVYDCLSGREAGVVSRGDTVVGAPTLAHVDSFLTRPREVRVLFDRELEVRFDFREAASSGTTEIRGGDQDARLLENVAPVPDVGGLVTNEKTYTDGTWLDFDSLFDGWRSTTLPITGVPPLSHTQVQKLYAWGGLAKLYAIAGSGLEDLVQMRRVAAILKHYRLTFRIPRRWRDRVRSIRPYRVAIVDPETGGRAPASVYADYCIFSSIRALSKKRNQAKFAFNVEGAPATVTTSLDSTACKLAPVGVHILDEDQGVFHLDFRLDPLGNAGRILPSKLVNIPSANPLDSIILSQFCALTASHKLAVVLSVVPAAPNDKRRLHVETVTPFKAGKVLGREVGRCEGPAFEIRISPGVSTARFGWDDAKSGAIENIFGVGATEPDDKVVAALGDPLNKDQIESVALAAAARLYASMVPRIEGEFTVGINPSLLPAGSVSSVTHSLGTESGALTTVDLPPILAPIDIYALLPDTVRRVVMRLAQP